MDEILYKKSDEREGNDSWLRYRLIIGYDFGDLMCQLSEKHSGWQGAYSDSKSFKLVNNSESYEKLKEYVEDLLGYNTVNIEKELENIESILKEENFIFDYIENN